MDSRRDFIKKAAFLSGGAALINTLPPVIQKAMAIDPAVGSTFYDAEHVVFLMQEIVLLIMSLEPCRAFGALTTQEL
jgi:phospholipase C